MFNCLNFGCLDLRVEHVLQHVGFVHSEELAIDQGQVFVLDEHGLLQLMLLLGFLPLQQFLLILSPHLLQDPQQFLVDQHQHIIEFLHIQVEQLGEKLAGSLLEFDVAAILRLVDKLLQDEFGDIDACLWECLLVLLWRMVPL